MSEQAASELEDGQQADELEQQVEQTEVEGEAQQAEPETGQEQESDEVVITLGDETPNPEDVEAEKAPQWVRDLRKSKREADKRIRELEAQIAKGSTAHANDPGPRPTLADCAYDDDEYAKKMEGWLAAKARADAEANRRQSEQEAMQRAFEERRNSYQASAKVLGVRDFEDAEAVAAETLSVVQQGIVINGADKPAELMYALGKNPAKAKELAAISDPVKFAFAVAKLETQMKVQPRKQPPPAERRVTGNAPVSGDTGGQERRLEEDARRTGDYSKLFEFRRSKRAA